MIVIEDLHKWFGDHHVLKGINLKIEKGKITVILGRSGCGKTVLVKHIIGLLKPDRGKIYIDGVEITSLSWRKMKEVVKKFGMLFQGSALFDSMTVEENVAFPLREHTRLPESEIKKRVREKLEVVGLKDVENYYPSELSGGMKKRVGLARAMALDPEYIIFDEPTTGVDPPTAYSIDMLMKETQRRFNLTFIVITHDISSTFRIADKIAMMEDGKIIEAGTPEEIMNSKNEDVKRFLEAHRLEVIR
jgi:phospholipid/cholesterol/gamma-HCH transport system ATP-binding protein